MASNIIGRVNSQVEKFKKDHRGQKPLYILVSSDEEEQLLKEVKEAGGYEQDTLVTEYKGSKIVKYDALKKGDIQLSDELPEISG